MNQTITQKDIGEFESYCEFAEGTTYILTAMARKKENEDIKANHEKMMRATASNAEDLHYNAARLGAMSDMHRYKTRLYISANRRDTMQGLFMLRSRMDEWLQNIFNGHEETWEKLGRIDSEWKSCLQKEECRDQRRFLFDLDDPAEGEMEQFEEMLESRTQIYLRNPTPNGIHFITDGFNYNDIETDIDYELKFDGATFIGYL